jgi:SAM-dependent methyltransferase
MGSTAGERQQGERLRHYHGAAGARYFRYQRPIGELGGTLDRSKFEKHIRSSNTVVDFGCGGGSLLAGLSARSKIGVEPNEPARAEAARRGINCVAFAAELEPGIADVVISNHALEHTLRPYDELRQLHRALKPGGKFVLWLPIDDWRSQRTVGDDPNHHLHTWTPLLLRNLLDEAGFDVRECRVVTHAWPPFTTRLARLPKPVFDALAQLWARLRRRRQLMAVAVRRN